MGNVLLPFDHMKACYALGASAGLSPDGVYERLFDSGLARQFELGTLQPEVFSTECQRRLGIETSTEALFRSWSDIFDENQAMTTLVEALSKRADLCLVSNTNLWHFNWVSTRFPVMSQFKIKILSFAVGAMKPDDAIFQAAASHVAPRQTSIFIDDVKEYANKACSFGFVGLHFTGYAQLVHQLRSLGISP